MDKEHLKKILAGVGIASLIGGAIVATPERALSA
jgi:radical SAM modification target selenobiotic family peptide